MTLNPNELNYLVYRYLLEQNYEHSAFAFYCEADVATTAPEPQLVPKGLLVALMQRALQILDIEMHIDLKGEFHPCTRPFSLFEPHNCHTALFLNQTLSRKYQPLFPKREREILESLPSEVVEIEPAVSIDKIYHATEHTKAQTGELIDGMLRSKFESRVEAAEEESERPTEESGKMHMDDIEVENASLLSMLDSIMGRSASELPEPESASEEAELGSNQPLVVPQPPHVDNRHRISISSHEITALLVDKAVDLLPSHSGKRLECVCDEILCKCCVDASNELEISDEAVFGTYFAFIGDANGQMCGMVFNEKCEFVSEPMLQGMGAPLVQICSFHGGNRVVAGEADGKISIFRIGLVFEDTECEFNVETSLLFEGYPFGSFQLIGLQCSDRFADDESLVAFGEASALFMLQLQNMSVVRLFDIPGTDWLLVPGPTVQQVYFGKNFIVTLLDNSTIALLHPRSSQKAVMLNIDEAACKMIVYADVPYIFTESEKAYVLNVEQAKLTQFSMDATVVDVVATTNGIVCMFEEHLVLIGGVEKGKPQIKFDWPAESPCASLEAVHNSVFALFNGSAFRIDPNIEYSVEIEIFDESNIAVLAACEGCIVAGSSTGVLWLDILVSVNE